MARSARPPEADYGQDTLRALLSGTGALIAHNPVIVGGTTAFLITLFYVSANAMWYQPHAHTGAFFATRAHDGYRAPLISKPALPQGETRIRIERRGATTPNAMPDTKPEPQGDPIVAKVQRILAELQLYEGPVDGLAGPKTHDAVAAYQKIVGLEIDGQITDALLDQLDGRTRPTRTGIPVPKSAPRSHDVAESHSSAASRVNGTETTASIATPSEAVKRVQAGLRAFGNDQIEVDGLMGAKTQSAIREFQTLFGLPVTGEADDPLVAKMREVGLIN